MQIPSLSPTVDRLSQPTTDAQELNGQRLQAADKNQSNLREAFDTFVGETFYGQMLKEMRKTVGKAAYFDGGRAEEVFRGQLDQKLAERMAKTNAHSFSGPMFELFSLNRK
ncbi:MAG TPA: rod-binding protein [Pirellulales bacterium]|jgi:Rod binding domain-containing protein|nr:rod-binding protein [Pirellulales bacterium]